MSNTNFENSAMKASFSLSSLTAATPDKCVPQAREFSSLKKRKEPTKRLSWGSSTSELNRTEGFWSPALKANYNYIMDNQLIDNCQDANCELSNEIRTWSLKEFYAQFSQLYSWLDSIQEKIYGHEDGVTDKALRAYCNEKLIKKQPFYAILLEQADQLIDAYPEHAKEVKWRLNTLNSKWNTILKPSEMIQDTSTDVQMELKCLKKWIKTMQRRMQPIVFHRRWTKTEIEAKATELTVVHEDLDKHGKIVNAIVKLCKRGKNQRDLDAATVLERRWHLLFLRSIEWHYHIENIRRKNSELYSDTSDCDDSPLKKARLSNNTAASSTSTDNSSFENDIDSSGSQCNGNTENDVMSHQEIQMEATNTANNSHPTMMGGIEKPEEIYNIGTYSFKHVDTDSDLEKIGLSVDNEAHTNSETSEEEWTYTPNDQQIANKINLRKIVQEVEQMVSPIKRTNEQTNKRIKQWLNMDKPDDSCDASSEDDNDTETSEELNESIATYRAPASLNTSYTDLGGASSPKVTLRARNKGKGQRPSSIACITQFSKSFNRIDRDSQNYSISESALHKLPLNALSGHNSTSSTIEDSCAMVAEEQNSPSRKKRFKLKKKSNFRKNELSSSPYIVGSTNRERVGVLVKSGSFSGCTCTPNNCERQTVSDPSAVPIGLSIDTSTTSGADSEEDKQRVVRRLPVFRLGGKTTYNLTADGRDESPGKFSLATTDDPTDELWDNYQEKYSSEAYSEAHDSDAARRLQEFGEDYRNYISSQSDYSLQSEFSPQLPRKVKPLKVIDSDTEANDLRKLVNESKDKYEFLRRRVDACKDNEINDDDTNALVETVATCDRHAVCLSTVEKNPEEFTLPQSDRKEFSDLIANWNALKTHANIMLEYRNLQSDILQLKHQFNGIPVPNPNVSSVVVSTIEDLSRDIDFYTAELSNIEDYKKKLLNLNVAVHHFMTENAKYNESSLKSDVSELYRIWYEIHNSSTERINSLNRLLQSWQMLETRLEQLRGDLRDDGTTLGALDSALQGGTFSNQMATSVHGVAKLLSETKSEGNCFPEIFPEGSFSDSGISDEGSEHDLGERERRLSAIRRLVRQLENAMAPDCNARLRMGERLVAAEEELKSLQSKCRSLIVRTAVSAAAPLSDQAAAASASAETVAPGPGGDPDDVPVGGSATSWFKRVVRASIPIQIAIMILLCVACMYEPHCCDNMNNLQYSMSPQLRYIRGPPPI